jgi:hypothetical protein
MYSVSQIGPILAEITSATWGDLFPEEGECANCEAHLDMPINYPFPPCGRCQQQQQVIEFATTSSRSAYSTDNSVSQLNLSPSSLIFFLFRLPERPPPRQFFRE